MQPMKISDINEFELIELIKKTIGNEPALMLGIGDDTCVWTSPSHEMLATTDSLIEGVHFEPDQISWHNLGYKALAVNLSDVAAMAGTGSVALVSLALPGNVRTDDVVSFYKGMLELARKTGIAIGGGNISRSPIINITVTLIGTAGPSGRVLKRSGARAGDLIAVTGFPGSSAAGRAILAGKHKTREELAAPLLDAFLRPAPLVTEAAICARLGASAAIDISDGLLADLRHLLIASNIGAIINTGELPLIPLLKAGFSHRQALEMALSGGEDYQLLFTAGAKEMEGILRAISSTISVIGTITKTEAGTVEFTENSELIKKLNLTGWRHFG